MPSGSGNDCWSQTPGRKPCAWRPRKRARARPRGTPPRGSAAAFQVLALPAYPQDQHVLDIEIIHPDAIDVISLDPEWLIPLGHLELPHETSSGSKTSQIGAPSPSVGLKLSRSSSDNSLGTWRCCTQTDPSGPRARAHMPDTSRRTRSRRVAPSVERPARRTLPETYHRIDHELLVPLADRVGLEGLLDDPHQRSPIVHPQPVFVVVAVNQLSAGREGPDRLGREEREVRDTVTQQKGSPRWEAEQRVDYDAFRVPFEEKVERIPGRCPGMPSGRI